MWLDNSHSCCSHSSATSIEDFTFPVSIHFKSISIRSLTLLDSGEAMCFMDEMFVRTQIFGCPIVQTNPIGSYRWTHVFLWSSHRSHCPTYLTTRGPPRGLNILHYHFTTTSNHISFVLVKGTESNCRLAQPLDYFLTN